MQVPAIKLDRPGMWAPKIVQSRARAQEATSLPRVPSGRAGAAQDSAAPEEPAAAAVTIAPVQCAAALAALSVQGAGGDLSLREVTEPFPEQAGKAPADLSPQQRESASSPERQLESRTATAHPSALSPEPEQDTAAQAQREGVPAPDAQLASEGLPVPRRLHSQPAKSAPLQDSILCDSKERRRANAALGARKALSSPLFLPLPELAGAEDVATSAVHPAAEAQAQSHKAPVEVYGGSQVEEEAGAVHRPAPDADPAPASRALAAAAADLMCSPFMQTLAMSDGRSLSGIPLGDEPPLLPACEAGPQSPLHHLQSSPSYCSDNSQAATVPGKLAAADRCTGGSVELAKTKSRQLSRQNSVICLPPKKRLQKRRCSRGTPPPSGRKPVAGQASHAAIPAATVSPSAAAESSAAEPATVTGSGKETGGKPSAAEQLSAGNGQLAEAQPSAAKQVSAADAPVAAGKPRRRPGRPPGSGKAARARALEVALPACSPEGRRPLKKSRKALEAEQVRLLLIHLAPECIVSVTETTAHQGMHKTLLHQGGSSASCRVEALLKVSNLRDVIDEMVGAG